MKILDIARFAHEVNRSYCAALGDNSQVEWDRAPNWQQESATLGVQKILENPEITPRELHESWMAEKVNNGWVFGETKDPVMKTHPCIRPYDELPVEQRAKDSIFRAVVLELVRLAADGDAHSPTLEELAR